MKTACLFTKKVEREKGGYRKKREFKKHENEKLSSAF